MYQVITIINGVYGHEGFFEDFRMATGHRDYTAECMYCGGVEGEVFINEIKR